MKTQTIKHRLLAGGVLLLSEIIGVRVKFLSSRQSARVQFQEFDTKGVEAAYATLHACWLCLSHHSARQ